MTNVEPAAGAKAEPDRNDALQALDLEAFCNRLSAVTDLDSAELAVAIMWWHQSHDPSAELTTWEIAKVMSSHGLGNPNRQVLSKRLMRSPKTLKGIRGFRLKTSAFSALTVELSETLGYELAIIRVENAFFPLAVWKNTRGYLERICFQLNGCCQYGFYDAAAVMLRRVTETLIIEAYEHLKRQQEIRNSQGSYFMLGELIDAALGQDGLSLGRDAKSALRDIKQLGDRAAHNRRFNAVKADLVGVRSGFRVAADELINLADLRRHN